MRIYALLFDAVVFSLWNKRKRKPKEGEIILSPYSTQTRLSISPPSLLTTLSSQLTPIFTAQESSSTDPDSLMLKQ